MLLFQNWYLCDFCDSILLILLPLPLGTSWWYRSTV